MRKVKQARTKPGPARAERGAPDEVLDLKAAADFLKVSKPTFYRWLAQGKIAGSKVGTQWRFRRRDLEGFLQTGAPAGEQVDADELKPVVEKARKTLGLPPITWAEPTEDETAEQSVVRQTADSIFAGAIEGRASDIHMDANSDEIVVRFRVDGVLSQVMTLPRSAHRPLLARLKFLGDMDIAERRRYQNGRIPLRYQEKEYDLRVSTFPAVYGESAVIRILDQMSVLIGMDRLGFLPDLQQAFERKLREPSGLIVVTGPAGSGRTTTLYSALNLLNSPRLKIATIEDPVEYRLRGLMQVHVNRKAGLTTAVALRGFVRGDPDIILVGDLRDLETAEVCMQAALTGHLVLTAMLPPDAPSVITRLIEMGMEPFMVGASLTAVLAQRLVRRVCPSCRVEYRPSPGVLRSIGMREEEVERATFYRGKGCAACGKWGYKGRTALFELLEMNDRLKEMTARRAGTAELRQAAIESGMVTMLQDGLRKASQGLTTIEEVMRVLAVAHYEG